MWNSFILKRPILVLENKVLIGFKEEEWKAEMWKFCEF